jgi:ribonuclease P protein component
MHISKKTFKKAERLCSKKLIDQLFTNQDTSKIHHYPLLLIWKYAKLESSYPAQVVFSVSKKYSNKAVQRNYIKRLLREAYRHYKDRFYEFLEQNQKQAAILLVYVGKEKHDYNQIKDSLEKIIKDFTLASS